MKFDFKCFASGTAATFICVFIVQNTHWEYHNPAACKVVDIKLVAETIKDQRDHKFLATDDPMKAIFLCSDSHMFAGTLLKSASNLNRISRDSGIGTGYYEHKRELPVSEESKFERGTRHILKVERYLVIELEVNDESADLGDIRISGFTGAGGSSEAYGNLRGNKLYEFD